MILIYSFLDSLQTNHIYVVYNIKVIYVISELFKIMINRLHILTESRTYTDYYSEFVKYKGKKIKIVIRLESNRFVARLYLLTNLGLNEFAYSTDFEYDVNKFNCNFDSIDNKNEKIKMINTLKDLSRDYITQIF